MSTLFSYFNRVEAPSQCSKSSPGNDAVSNSKTPAPAKSGVKKVGRKRRLIIESDESDEEMLDSPRKVIHLSDESDTGSPTCLANVNNSYQKATIPARKKLRLASTWSNCGEVYAHNKLKWLQSDSLKDKNGHGVTHPDYDPRTLQVPQDYYKKLTPGFQQWWTIKANNFDSVIMFKVGKFYELYHMDAVVGVQELGLVFMKAEFAHCGFPEAGFGRYSDALVQKGHKVVRVEQVETPALMEQRIKQTGAASKSDRVVRREVCSVITKGTRTLSFFEGCSNCESLYLLALKENLKGDGIEYGVCFLDTCIGTIHIGQFKDDGQSSRLRTLLAHYPPGHVLYERRGLSPRTNHFIDLLLPSSIKELLVPDAEFWSASKTLKILAESDYFNEWDCQKWPSTLKLMLNDALGLSPASGYELALSALGACVWCLKRAHIDNSILTLASFKLYQPLDSATTQNDYLHTKFSSQRLILDDITLANLDIIGSPGHQAGTLLEKIDYTVTAFGKRLLQRWMCAPLTSPSDIVSRQDAVEQLMKSPSLMTQAKNILCRLPDLERLLRKIHSFGCHSKDKDHPESRAILFEHIKYNKRKIADFISILDGLRMALKLLDILKPVLDRSESPLLCKLLRTGKGGDFPDIEEQLLHYETSFDRVKAKEDGVIIPNQGVNPDYDASNKEVEEIHQDFDQYLEKQRQRLGCKTVSYWGNGRNRFQLEIPVSVISKQKIQEYELSSQRKGFRRYRTPAIEEMLRKLGSAEERRDAALRSTMGDLFHSFDQHFISWENTVQCLSILDVLLSLATYSGTSSEEMCRPSFTSSGSFSPSLEVRGGRHPCVIHTHSGGAFIPNDVLIEGSHSCLLVTGPNMGGKSTLMRQTGLIVVLAQLGSFVPATKCRFSPVDRVFTRMGASDRIMAKESTFFVELKETSSVLQHATHHSLVLIDELGRGTATYDGAAIASAVVQQLTEVGCRTLFSTHYHFLVHQFIGDPHVGLGHMACMVEGEDEESITFLYKLTEGPCPNSYGFNVAQLADLPKSVIALARKKAISCESDTQQIRTLRKLLKPGCTIHELKDIKI